MSRTERTSSKSSASEYVAPLAAVAGLVLTALLLWDMASGERLPRRASPSFEARGQGRVPNEPERPAEDAPYRAPAADDDIPVKPAGTDASFDDERMRPHPIDEPRRRIYRENDLHGAMMGAMNVGDYQGLRALVEEYRLDAPEDPYRLQEGYSLIADCLERLTPERKAAAREYWTTKRGSTARRFVRRHCLDRRAVND